MIRLTIDRNLLFLLRGDRAVHDAAADLVRELEGRHGTEMLLPKLLSVLFERIPAERGAVILADKDGRDLDRTHFRENPFAINKDVAGSSFRERTAVLVRNSAPKPSEVLCVPLCLQGSTVGAIYLESKRPGAFTEDHLRLLALVAAETAGAVDAARHADSLQVQQAQYEDYLGYNHGLVGKSAAIAALRTRIEEVGPTLSTVLILGEMGTGKEVVARALRRASPREHAPFMAVNCGAIRDTLIESELFGYERGAFTGAAGTKIGKVEAANNGTLFLDEIGELTMPMQAALLRALQEREFQRVGGTEDIRVDIRVIAATNRDLKQRIADGLFRKDLFDRLNVVPLRTPALREIREDIPLLVEQFMQDLRYVRIVEGIAPDALDALCRYHWPGNVRELRNVVEYALGRSRHAGVVQVEFLPDSVWDPPEEESSDTLFEESRLVAAERALRKCKGNVRLAAAEIDVTPRHMRRLKQEILKRQDR